MFYFMKNQLLCLLLFFQLMTEFGSESEVKQIFDVFSNVLQDNTGGVVKALSGHTVPYYWQVYSLLGVSFINQISCMKLQK